MIDTAGLRIMRAISEQGSFTAAAHSLGYTQPAISQMVRRLEGRIGTPLVERQGRTVRLTQAGQVLARHAVTVLSLLDTAEQELSALAGLQSGRVRVAAFPSSSAALVPHALRDLRAEHPAIEIQLTEAEPPESLAALRDGRCDLAVAFSHSGTPVGREVDDLAGLEIRDILTDEMLIALPEDHPQAGGDTVALAALADDPWIAGCARCRGHLMHLGQEAGFIPRVEFQTEDYVAVLGLVSAGLGAALVPRMVLRHVRHEGVVALPLSQRSERTIHAVTTADLLRVPAVAAMMDSLCRAAGEMAPEQVVTARDAGHPTTDDLAERFGG
ncbi:LysR family transcriptional regulator [Kytococcus sedentarius]|uniref:Transcriptional regulator n=1 Tax=Kytococcus sedentarius (strain ATCC 14392 / DSM 20547 / JCM 11482 / CCUG 33030 / NBRC 15357 / NCTC 11040 / CCM 314 / 541) TaxID=478801 RepID=C7NJ53_KYTSD|nr:LysR family transcriptional regulator [Kytococcus sedentarius]ACV06740.1 transcriptional regulator [Kytococcus sedentarius DSM 20547]QQB65015.1 LysR family transcriptional regulator [Kytococcus sedentarius]STX14446.1 Cyn operon transcriptional activator [Kytococcus sedentarius]